MHWLIRCDPSPSVRKSGASRGVRSWHTKGCTDLCRVSNECLGIAAPCGRRVQASPSAHRIALSASWHQSTRQKCRGGHGGTNKYKYTRKDVADDRNHRRNQLGIDWVL